MGNVSNSAPRSFGSYLLGTFIRPGRTFEALLADDRGLRLGLAAIGLNALLYTLVYVFLWHGGGAPSSFTPWLAVPKEVYYFYNRFWLAPSMLAGWVLAAGVAHLLSKLIGGRGSFEDTLAVFGFGLLAASLAALLHDLPDSSLGAIGLLDLRWYEMALNSPTIWRAILLTLYAIYGILMLFLLIRGVKDAQRIKTAPAILIGFVAFALYQGMFLLFNR
ncbi:MAG: YIP1 family protein [Bacteroidetes bacterium]|nr:YIP1 family protein [Bacteroidota bacterium]